MSVCFQVYLRKRSGRHFVTHIAENSQETFNESLMWPDWDTTTTYPPNPTFIFPVPVFWMKSTKLYFWHQLFHQFPLKFAHKGQDHIRPLQYFIVASQPNHILNSMLPGYLALHILLAVLALYLLFSFNPTLYCPTQGHSSQNLTKMPECVLLCLKQVWYKRLSCPLLS